MKNQNDEHRESDDFTLNPLVFRGLQSVAHYRKTGNKVYDDNPLICALPGIMDSKEFFERTTYLPIYDESDRQLPSMERLHLLMEATRFFQPLGMHFELEKKISLMLRTGLRGRNPLDRDFWKGVNARVEAVRSQHDQGGRNHDVYGTSNPQFRQYVHNCRSSANSCAMIGPSGLGKSVSLQTILSLYPQVLFHCEPFKGQKINMRQLVWLMVECPHNGSVRQLCFNFLRAVDDILETSYERDYGQNSRANESALVSAMSRVAALHGVGFLVIDEINNLRAVKNGGEEKMLNFFVSLTNTVGIPLLLVGTPSAAHLFTGALRMARRGAGMGDIDWQRLENDQDFKLFVESLWRYQYTQTPTPFNDELVNVLYDETQGIIDFTVKVYMLAQMRAIASRPEVINEQVIRSVAADSLQLAQPMLEALRLGDIVSIQKFEDIVPINLSVPLEIARQVITAGKGKEKENPKKKPKMAPPVNLPDGVNTRFTQAGEEGIPVYEGLDQAGLIKSGAEFFSGASQAKAAPADGGSDEV